MRGQIVDWIGLALVTEDSRIDDVIFLDRKNPVFQRLHATGATMKSGVARRTELTAINEVSVGLVVLVQQNVTKGLIPLRIMPAYKSAMPPNQLPENNT